MGGSRICRGYIVRYTFRFSLPVYNEETFCDFLFAFRNSFGNGIYTNRNGKVPTQYFFLKSCSIEKS